MESFTLLLGVREWTYSRQQHRDWKTGEYETRRSIGLRCFWNDGSGFLIDGQLFREPINTRIVIGEPIKFPEPVNLEFIKTHYRVDSGLGKARYHPRSVRTDGTDEIGSFLDISLVVSSEVFAELLEMRHELKTMQLDVMGNNIKLDFEGELSWDHANSKDNALYIMGFNYTTEAA